MNLTPYCTVFRAQNVHCSALEIFIVGNQGCAKLMIKFELNWPMERRNIPRHGIRSCLQLGDGWLGWWRGKRICLTALAIRGEVKSTKFKLSRFHYEVGGNYN